MGFGRFIYLCHLGRHFIAAGFRARVVGFVEFSPRACVARLAGGNPWQHAGGAIGWGMGWGAERWMAQRLHQTHMSPHMRALRWLERLGPVACLGAWLPIIGDPLCVVAGYLRLPFWPCVVYMALGKGLRYAMLVGGWQWVMLWLPSLPGIMS